MPVEVIQTIIVVVGWLLFGFITLAMFRKTIINLFNRASMTKISGFETHFQNSQNQIEPPNQAISISPEQNKSIKWHNTGNLFWIGHDLMWTFDAIRFDAPRNTIIHGLNQSIHHLTQLGFENLPIMQRLNRLRDNAEQSLENDWTPAKRTEYAKEVADIIQHIGSTAAKNQPKYLPNP